jgi:hypothetical protein
MRSTISSDDTILYRVFGLDLYLFLLSNLHPRGLECRSRLRRASSRQTSQQANLKEAPLLGMLAIAGTGYGLIGLLVIILLIVLIVYFARRA